MTRVPSESLLLYTDALTLSQQVREIETTFLLKHVESSCSAVRVQHGRLKFDVAHYGEQFIGVTLLHVRIIASRSPARDHAFF